MRNKNIGIWGFGTVGKSALVHFAAHDNQCMVLDKRELLPDEKTFLSIHHATYLSEEYLDYFFAYNDIIFASPGIDINPYKDRAQFICELDVFAPLWKKSIIAITGTVGKTSTTTLLGKLLQQTMRVAVGGNIGTPMLQFLEHPNVYDYAVLELSSWQLEHAQPFAPDIAIWTNFHPNHLDRHKTLDAYFNAKLNILLHQTAKQTAILPLSLYDRIAPLNLASRKIWIANKNDNFIPKLTPTDQLLCIEKNTVMLKSTTDTLLLGNINTVPLCTYMQNMLIAAVTLHVLSLPFKLLTQTDISIEHRLEKINTKNSITFYNDSKATVPESTLAALTQLKDKNIILFLGGLSKGVDRRELIHSLPANVKYIICFGNEAEQLKKMCETTTFSCAAFDTLEPALVHALEKANAYDVILFSPAGSSFDLYTNYQERGQDFKQLVMKYNEILYPQQ